MLGNSRAHGCVKRARASEATEACSLTTEFDWTRTGNGRARSPKFPRIPHRGESSQRAARNSLAKQTQTKPTPSCRNPLPQAENGIRRANGACAGDETNPLTEAMDAIGRGICRLRLCDARTYRMSLIRPHEPVGATGFEPATS